MAAPCARPSAVRMAGHQGVYMARFFSKAEKEEGELNVFTGVYGDIIIKICEDQCNELSNYLKIEIESYLLDLKNA